MGSRLHSLPTCPARPVHIYIVSADGGALEEVSHGERDECFPTWSRDGDSLFFGNLQLTPEVLRHLSAELEDQPTHDRDRFSRHVVAQTFAG